MPEIVTVKVVCPQLMLLSISILFIAKLSEMFDYYMAAVFTFDIEVWIDLKIVIVFIIKIKSGLILKPDMCSFEDIIDDALAQ